MIIDFYKARFPRIDVTAEFVLREQRIEDAEPFFEYYRDPEVSRYILATLPATQADAKAEIAYCANLFKEKRGIYWTLARKEDNRMVGAVGLYINNQHHRGEICYDLARPYWNQGLMTQTLKKVVHVAFNWIGLNRVEAITLKDNLASTAILTKLGFDYEGTLRNYRYFNGTSHDIEMYSILPLPNSSG